MDLNQALEVAQEANSVLFLGAGASWGAKNVIGDFLPSGSELAAKLAIKLSLPPDTALDRLADFYIEDFGSTSLISFLKELLTASEIAEHHKAIADVDWMRIYTTNYDNVFEFARDTVARPVVPAVLSDVPDALLPVDDCCVHINGSILQLDETTLSSQFKLSTTSYLTQHFQESQWVDVFRTDLRMADSAIFVGYSMYDLDIQRLVFESPANRAKTFFVVSRNERRDSERILSRFGSVDKIGVEFLGTLLKQQKARSHSSPVKKPHIFRKWKRYSPATPATRSVTEDDILRLLLWGTHDESLEEKVAINHEAGPYFFSRNVVRRIVDILRKPRACVVVHSHLGNGKSVVERQVYRNLFDNGFAVYSLIADDTEAHREAREIVEGADVPTVLCISNYVSCVDVINDLATIANAHVRFMLVSRTSANDVTFPLLRESLRDKAVEISVNKVHPDDLDGIIDYFTRFAIWQEFSGESKNRKQTILRVKCSSEISSMLMLLLKSPQIRKRLDDVVATFRKDNALCNALIAVMILNTLGDSYSPETLLDLVDPELPQRLRRACDTRINDIVDITGGRIVARSSVAATFLLQEVFTPDRVVPVLVKLVKEAAKRSYVYQGLLKELVRYSNVQAVLAHEKGRLRAAVDFYEEARRISWLNKSIHFWLQYGIARLSLESGIDDIEHAERYFSTAYAMAERIPGYNTDMIDNHYARLLIVKAQYPVYEKEWYELWTKARDILLRQAGRFEVRHFPYKVATGVEKLFEQLLGKMSKSQEADLLRFCQNIVESIESLSEDTRCTRLPGELQRLSLLVL